MNGTTVVHVKLNFNLYFQSEVWQNIAVSASKERLLVHVCCAPDFTTSRQWFGERFEVTGFFYNPNIYPSREYALRLEQALVVARSMEVSLVEGAFEPDGWESEIPESLRGEPEGGARCRLCFGMRLRETARWARANGFNAFTTTLTISPHKRANLINRLGAEAAMEAGVRFVADDLKKRDGFTMSVHLSKTLGLYRQKYCGCRYSIPPAAPAD